MLAAIGDGAVCTINALSPDVYAGTSQDELRPARTHSRQQEPLLRVDPRRTDRSAAPTKSPQQSNSVGARTADRIITYCGGGISATVDAFALKLIGYDNVAVYDGSMSEWVRDPNLPLVTGAAP